MWYSSVMPQCSNQRTSERAQLLSAMTHPSTVLDLDAKQSFVTPKSYILYIYIYIIQMKVSRGTRIVLDNEGAVTN